MKLPANKMKIGALAPWFGSKRTLAARISAELGPHRVYWETLCGSLAVLLAKEPCRMETVCDLHGDLINLARVLQIEPLAIELYSRLSRTLMHEGLFTEAAERWKARGHQPAPDPPDLERAVDFMVCSWMGRNGVAGTESYNQGFCVRYTSKGGNAGKRWSSVIDSIPAWHERLRRVTILNRDAFEIIPRIEDADGVAIYIDPPYLEKGAKYIHDFGATEHGRLAHLLARFKRTRIVVSYYDHPLLAEMYKGWTKLACPTTKALVNQGTRDRGGAVTAPEVLLINGPSLTQEAGLFQ